MGKQDEDTGIGWTHFTFNLWNGCFKVSPGCANCYAAELDKWLRKGEHWGPGSPRLFFGGDHWQKPLAWNRAAMRAGERRRVFCSSVCDWAEFHPDPKINARMDVARAAMWALIAQTEWLDWLLLTKRIENVPDYLPKRPYSRPDWPGRVATDTSIYREPWSVKPWPNVWIGTTVENDDYRWRIDRLMDIEAKVHFVSYEPALGAIDWAAVKRMPEWVIFGDESGRGRRPAELEWARQARDACLARGKKFFLKQLHHQDPRVTGNRSKKGAIHLPVLDGRLHRSTP